MLDGTVVSYTSNSGVNQKEFISAIRVYDNHGHQCVSNFGTAYDMRGVLCLMNLYLIASIAPIKL